MGDLLVNISPVTFIKYSILAFILLALLIMNLANRSKIKKLKAKYYRFMSGQGDQNIEELLETCIEKVNKVSEKNRDIENHINNIERNLMQCVQKVGIIRFNAFENVGSDLSFSIALLDNNDNGIVLSGIYSRDSSSSYAKPIISGKSRYPLSAEEIQALETAKKTNRERVYID